MTWFWEALNIEPTNEIYLVKKAYVNQVKFLKSQEIKGLASQGDFENLTAAEKAAITWIERDQQGVEHIPESFKVDQGDLTEQTIEPISQSEVIVEKQGPTKVSLPKKEEDKLIRVTESSKTLIDEEEKAPLVMAVNELDFMEKLKALVADWPHKIQLNSWIKLFTENNSEFSKNKVTYRQEFLPILVEEMQVLPKEILFYLYEVFEMDQLELSHTKNWYHDISQLPNFSFQVALYLEAKDCYPYFKQRLKLYELISRPDWQSHSFEIKKFLLDFTEKKQWLQNQTLIDRDVENLGAIFSLKEELETIVSKQGTVPKVEKYLLPVNSDLSQEANETAIFLRVIFTSLRRKQLSGTDRNFLETKQEIYLEKDLKALLIGLAYHSAGETERALSHFHKIKGSYAQLVKPFVGKPSAKALLTKPAPKELVNSQWLEKLSPALIFRVVVLMAVGIALLGNVFQDDEDDFSNYEEFEEVQSDEDVFPDTIEGEFYEYFVRQHYREDRATRQNEFINDYVADDIKDVFFTYQKDYEIAEGDYEIRSSADEWVRSQGSEDQDYYLSLHYDAPEVLLVVENYQVVRVVGVKWEEVSEKEWLELVETVHVSPQKVVTEIVEKYYGEEDWEISQEQIESLTGIVNQTAYDQLMDDEDVNLAEALTGGFYQVSQTATNEPLILVFDNEDALLMTLELDSYGRLIFISGDYEEAISESELAELIKKAEKPIPLKINELSDTAI